MRHHDQRLAELPVEPLQQPHHQGRRLLVEIARRLVGQDDRGVGHDGPRDRDPLLLSAAELAGVVIVPVGDPDEFERRRDALVPLPPGSFWSSSGSSTFSYAVSTGIRL